MINVFDSLINSYIDNKVGIAEDFLSPRLAEDLKQNLMQLYSTKQMSSAGIGNQSVQGHDKLVRNDMIYWLDKKHDNKHEDSFFTVMDDFVHHLNNSCYTGITGYEFHYALYEKGSFYKKHVDPFQNNESRQYSMIIYLNDEWVPSDGGQLAIHHANHEVQQVDPVSGKTVFFKSSELEHEVLITSRPRMSITGWLKRG